METREITFAPNYLITSEGKIYSKNYKRQKSCKEIAIHQSIGGYPKVNLRVNKKTKAFLVHRLVAEAFIPNPLNLPQINHRDFNKKNNDVSNLEWCTCQYNIQYTVKNGKDNKALGEENGKHKLDANKVLRIRQLFRQGDMLQKDIAKLFNVHPWTISHIVRNLIWKHI